MTEGNGDHFLIQHPKNHQIYQKYPMQLISFLQASVIKRMETVGCKLLQLSVQIKYSFIIKSVTHIISGAR